MNLLNDIYITVNGWETHRYGWIFIAALLIIPALVSSNMFIHYLTLIH